MTRDVVVIGGGPAGMTAAIFAARAGLDVLLLEKNEKLGKKLYITGNGRCNVTNNASPREIVENTVSNSRFCYGAVNRFSPQDAMQLLEQAGLSLKTERGGRVFPASDKSSDVIKAFTRLLSESGAEVALNCPVADVIHASSKDGYSFRVLTMGGEYRCKRLVLATGGCSYRSTGSTGDGYRIAGCLGHSIADPKAALCPILLKDDVSRLEGLSLKNVRLSAVVDGKTYGGEMGEMLFTARGISGPLTLSLSSQITRLSLCGGYVSIDLKPALSHAELDRRVLRDFEEFSNKLFKNALDKLLPKSLIFDIIKGSKINPEKPVHQVSAEERATLVSLLKDFRLRIDRLEDIDRAIVTSGGVKVLEINPATMESKLVKGLFFAGELVDIDAYTGGYNVQLAMSTGWLAGNSCAKE